MAKLIETLFFDGAKRGAVLVINRDGRRSRKPKLFRDPHAALDWCISRNAGFVYTPGAPHTN
jgi:hypothetical protein